MLCFHTTLTTLVHTTYRDRCKYSSKPRRRPVSHIVYARLLYSCDRSHELAGRSCNTCENQHYQLSSVVQLYLVLDSAQPLRTCGRAEGRHVSRLCVCVCVCVCMCVVTVARTVLCLRHAFIVSDYASVCSSPTPSSIVPSE